MVIWTFLSLLVLFLAGCFLFLSSRAKEVKRREKILYEKLWDRLNKLPLLIETVSKTGIANLSVQEIIDLREKASTSIYIDERAELERELTRLINDVLRACEKSQETTVDVAFITLKKEFLEGLESIRIAFNDYNFAVQKWIGYCKMPWYKIFEFAFEARGKWPLEPF